MDSLADFAKIAEFLMHPLVLVGFVLMMVFSIHKQVLKPGGPIDKVKPRQAGLVLALLLRYGFWLGVVIMLLGFGLQFYKTYADKEVKASGNAAQSKPNPIQHNTNGDNISAGHDINFNIQYSVPQNIVDILLKKLDDKDVDLQERDITITSWIQKYKDLESKLSKYNDPEAKQAKAFLANGQLENAERLFKQICVESNDYSERMKKAADARKIGDIITAEQHERIAKKLPTECQENL